MWPEGRYRANGRIAAGRTARESRCEDPAGQGSAVAADKNGFADKHSWLRSAEDPPPIRAAPRSGTDQPFQSPDPA